MSKGELKIEQYLKNKNIAYEKQKKFEDCKCKLLLPFDFYVSSYNLCIEYDGEQHFYPVSCYGGDKCFMGVKYRDSVKNEYCYANKIKILRIPYFQFDQIELILEDNFLVLKKLISGGQEGSDFGSLKAAKKMGVPTGGTAPKGFLTEAGSNPLLGSMYGLVEHKSSQYPPRTFENVKNSDGTIRLAINFGTAGERLTLKAINQYNKPYIDVDVADPIGHEVVVKWIIDNDIKILNVAGNRESTFPGIEDFVEKYLSKVIEILFKESNNG